MAAGNEQSFTDAIKYDVRVMHETWMEFLFPRQRGAADTVLGKWEPQETREVITYRLWSALGVPVISVVYPLVLLGYLFRYQTRKINVTAVRLGLVGVVLVFTLLWGGLAALVYLEFQWAFQEDGPLAIVAASGVAVFSSALAYLFWRVDGRPTTVLFAYPLAVTAIFLPPVVAALFSTYLADLILTRSDSLASWFVNEGPSLGGAVDYLEQNFERKEYHHVLIWFGISFPVGWVLGFLVTLADLIRPKSE
jgi:hypothetical protein